MKTRICPTCGCSLVRLGISKDQAVVYNHEDEDRYFCCQACVDVFVTDPDKYLQETKDLTVCPTCLAEKPPEVTVALNHSGQELHFCRCPYCTEVFRKSPDYYMKRLEGTIANEGVLDHEGCCIRPE